MALAFSSTLAPRLLPSRLPKVCLALSADTVEDMLAIAESMARDNPFIELRLDYLKQPLAALPKIHRFLETHQYITANATCNLDQTLEKMLIIPADFYKVVSTATTLSDNVAMMKFLQTQSGKHVLI